MASRIAKASYGISVAYPLALTLPKLAICAFYLQISDVHTGMRITTLAMIVFLTMNMVAWGIPSILVCQSISAYWATGNSRGKCINTEEFGTWISKIAIES